MPLNGAGWRSTRDAHPFMRGLAPDPDRAKSGQAQDTDSGGAPGAAANEVRHENNQQQAAPTPQQPLPDPDVEQRRRTVPDAGELHLFKQEDGSAVALLPVRLPSPSDPQPLTGRVDKSVLALPEPKRRRDRHHLKFVASQPCLVCARTPSQAHHLRIAQPRALGRKVSDEFTVPLCALHHHDLHMKGNETEWWWGHTIDPLPIAERLWMSSRHGVEPRETDGSSAAE